MRRKVITMCGSFRFLDKMNEVAEQLALDNGYVVIGMTSPTPGRELTDSDKALLGELHLAKIDLSDAIFVVNVDGYIGDAVKHEIAYAMGKGKEIIYLE